MMLWLMLMMLWHECQVADAAVNHIATVKWHSLPVGGLELNLGTDAHITTSSQYVRWVKHCK